MATEERQYAGATVATAKSQLGYNPGRTYSKYGEWYGLPNALWCACGATWCAYIALGTRAAKAILGAQPFAPKGRGYAWTVRWREHLQATGTKIPLARARAGDVLFFKYPTSDDRNTNPVNHVDLVVGSATSTYIPTIGFNTPRPGSGGDPSNGRGVWNHNRALTDRYIVDCYRPPWWRHPDLVIYTQGGLGELGYDPGPIDGDFGKRTEAAVLAFQKDHPPLVVDGKPGPATRAAIGVELAKPEPAPEPPAPEPTPTPEPVKEVPDMSEHRIAGRDRFETMAKAAVTSGRSRFYLAGTEVDALGAVTLGDGAVLLVKPGEDELPESVTEALLTAKPTDVKAVGGSTRVTDKALHTARTLAGLDS